MHLMLRLVLNHVLEIKVSENHQRHNTDKSSKYFGAKIAKTVVTCKIKHLWLHVK